MEGLAIEHFKSLYCFHLVVKDHRELSKRALRCGFYAIVRLREAGYDSVQIRVNDLGTAQDIENWVSRARMTKRIGCAVVQRTIRIRRPCQLTASDLTSIPRASGRFDIYRADQAEIDPTPISFTARRNAVVENKVRTFTLEAEVVCVRSTLRDADDASGLGVVATVRQSKSHD